MGYFGYNLTAYNFIYFNRFECIYDGLFDTTKSFEIIRINIEITLVLLI